MAKLQINVYLTQEISVLKKITLRKCKEFDLNTIISIFDQIFCSFSTRKLAWVVFLSRWSSNLFRILLSLRLTFISVIITSNVVEILFYAKEKCSHAVIFPSFLHVRVLYFNFPFIILHLPVPFPRKGLEQVTLTFLNEYLWILHTFSPGTDCCCQVFQEQTSFSSF